MIPITFPGSFDSPPAYEPTQQAPNAFQANEVYLLDEQKLRFQALFNKSAPAHGKTLNDCLELMERSLRQKTAIAQWINRASDFVLGLDQVITAIKLQQHNKESQTVLIEPEEACFSRLASEKKSLATSMQETIKACQEYVKQNQLPEKLDVPTIQHLLSALSMQQEDVESFLQIQRASLLTINTECGIMAKTAQAMNEPWKKIEVRMTELRRLNAPGMIVQAGNYIKWGASSSFGAACWLARKVSAPFYTATPLETAYVETAYVPFHTPLHVGHEVTPSAPPHPALIYSCDLPVEQLYPDKVIL